MFAPFILQLAVGVLATLFLSLLLWLGARRRTKSGPAAGAPSRLAKWLVEHRWTVTAINWGVAMYAAMVVTPAVTDAIGGKGLHIGHLLIGVPLWALGGLLFGWAMSFTLPERRKKSVFRH